VHQEFKLAATAVVAAAVAAVFREELLAQVVVATMAGQAVMPGEIWFLQHGQVPMSAQLTVQLFFPMPRCQTIRPLPQFPIH
jgi:hypothetical protein